MDCHCESLRPYVVEISTYDIILGDSWLEKRNPETDWRPNRSKFKSKGRIVTMAPLKKDNPQKIIISAMQLKNATKKKCEVFELGIRDVSERQQPRKSNEQRHIESLLEEFEDIFPEELPRGLPAKRVIDHNIEIGPNAKAPVRPLCRLSNLELEELQKQLE